MVLVGNLKDLRLANIIQINCIERNIAKVTVTSNNKKGYLYFADGNIKHAEFSPYIGERAVQEMLSLSDGKFKVEAEKDAPANTITKPWNSVVLEGLRLLDEKNQKLSPIPKQMFNVLSEQKGVRNVFVLDLEGRILEGKLKKELDPVFIVFMWYKFKKIQTLFYAQSINYTYIRNQNGYLFIIEFKPNLIVIETDLMIIVDEFINKIKGLLKNIA